VRELTERQRQMTAIALRHLSKHDIDSLRMRAIAEEIGISDSTAYKHFKSKDDLLKSVAESIKNYFTETLETIFQSSQPSITKIRDFYISRLEGIQNDPAYNFIAIVPDLIKNHEIFKEAILPSLKSAQMTFIQTVKEGQKKNEIRADLDPWHIHNIVISTLQLLIKEWLGKTQKFDLKEKGEKQWNTIEMLLAEQKPLKDILKKSKKELINEIRELHRKIASLETAKKEKIGYEKEKNGAIFSEIAEKKKIEKNLIDTDRKFYNFIEQIDDLVACLDIEGKITYVNNAAEEILGLKKEHCIGLYAFDFTHGDDYEKTKKAFENWLKDKTPTVVFEDRVVSRRGEITNIRWTVNTVFDTCGNTTGTIAIGHNITELRLLQKKLKKGSSPKR